MGQQRIKLAAFDLDDTLLLPEGTLSERARAAIEKAADLGMEIVLASGRSFSSLPAELLGMPQIHYAITSNGAAVNEVPSGKRILARCLSPESIRVILKLLGKRSCSGSLCRKGFPMPGKPICRIRNPTAVLPGPFLT